MRIHIDFEESGWYSRGVIMYCSAGCFKKNGGIA